MGFWAHNEIFIEHLVLTISILEQVIKSHTYIFQFSMISVLTNSSLPKLFIVPHESKRQIYKIEDFS